MSLSEDGKRVALRTEIGGRTVIARDGKVLPDYGPDWIVTWPPGMSTDGSVLAFRLTHRERTLGCIGVDGRRGEEFDAVGPPALSADGSRMAYRAQRGGRSFIVNGEHPGPSFEFVSDPAISADGRVVAYAALRDGTWTLFTGDRETPLQARPDSVFVSRNGSAAGIIVSEGVRSRVVVGADRGDAFTLVGKPSFSPDGRRIAYAADEGTRQYVVVGHRKIEVEGRVSDPAFSPDGTQVGYGVRNGREIWWKVLNVD